jgi:hypothetical protein
MKKQYVLLFFVVLMLVPLNMVIAQTISSPNYNIENSEFNIGGENSSSASYRSQDALGGSGDAGSSSTNYKTSPGVVPGNFPGVPAAPTLTNTGGTLYNSLDFVIATGGNGSDTQYSIALSSDNFTTTFFIQTDDTLGSTEAWQTYANWNSGTGERVTGLLPNTAYQIKVKARHGVDTESGYSVTATAATVNPTLTVSIVGVASGQSVAGETTTITSTASALSFGSLQVGTPNVAAHTVTVTTNATGGYTTTVVQDGNLRKSNGETILAVTATNASPAAFPTGITTGRIGYHTTDATLCTGTATRFSVNDTYAALTTTPTEVICNSGPTTSEATSLVYKVVIGNQQPAGSYANTVTYITTATY